jgi:hypothetical protein
LKRQQKYAALVAELSEYLVSFLKRTQPLVNVEAMVAKECDQPFEVRVLVVVLSLLMVCGGFCFRQCCQRVCQQRLVF